MEYGKLWRELILCKINLEDFGKLKKQFLDAHKELDTIKAEKNGMLNDLRSVSAISMKYA